MRSQREPESNRDGQQQTPWQRWWPFVLLLFLGASRWLLGDARPETRSTLASQALGCVWAALLTVLLLHRPGPAAGGPEPAAAWRDLIAGALLLGGPASALLIGGSQVDGSSVTIALALTPVAIAISAAALGSSRPGGVSGRAWPGLAAVAGLLLVLAQPDLTDARSDTALLLAPLLTGLGAALFCEESPRSGVRQAQSRATPRKASSQRAATALAGGALLFGVAAAAWWILGGNRPSSALPAIACDGLIALVEVLALARLGAIRWSAQFVLLPLLILLQGILLVHPAVTARALLGLGLLALGSAALLLPPADDPTDGPAVVPR